MSNITAPQLTLNFEPSLPERFPTLRSYIAHRTPLLSKPAKVIAADMDLNPSTLSRKLNPADGDTQRFNLDDLELYLSSTGEAVAVIEYIAAKYLDSDANRQARALSTVERLSADLAKALASLKGAAA